MPSEPTILDVVPVPGMKQGLESRIAPPGTVAYAQNVRWEKPGRIVKRGGSEAIGVQPGTMSVGGSWVHENLACIDDGVFLYDEATGNWSFNPDGVGRDTPFHPIGRYPAVITERVNSIYAAAVGVVSGTIILAYADTDFVGGTPTNITVMGFTSDGRALWRTATFSGTYPRLTLAGSTLYLTWLSGTGLRARTVSASGTLGSDTAIDAAGAYPYDAAPLAGTTDWVVAYGAGNITCKRLSGLSVTATRTVTATTVVNIAVAGGGATNDTIWVVYQKSTGVFYEALKWDLSGSWSGGSINAQDSKRRGQPTVLRTSATTCIIACGALLTSGTSLDIPNFAVRTVSVDNVGTVGAVQKHHGWLLASKFWPPPGSLVSVNANRGRCVVKSITSQRHAFLECVDSTGGAIIGATFERDASSFTGVGATDEHLTECALFDPDGTGNQNLVTALLWEARNADINKSGTLQAMLAVDLLRFGGRPLGGGTAFPASAVRSIYRAPLSGMHYVGGGAGLVEVQPVLNSGATRCLPMNGFILIPRVKAEAVAGSGLTASTAYSYVATFEHIDDFGNLCRSEPSVAVTITTDATNKRGSLEATVPGGTCRANVVLHIWRSQDGGPYHRVTPDLGAPLCTDTSTYPTADYVAFTDNMSDATASTRQELDTDSLPSAPPSGAGITCEGGGRLFATDWLGRVWASKLYVLGEPYNFVDDDAFRIFPSARPTGLAALDGALVIFTEAGIEVVSLGQGPTDGGQNPYDVPTKLPTDEGCVNPRSVIETSVGILYQSRRGIMLLPRGLGAPVFVGEDVSDLTQDRPFVLNAAKSLHPNGSALVHFAINTSQQAQGFDGLVLVFDVALAAWSVDKFRWGVSALGTRKDRLAFVVKQNDPADTKYVRWIPEDTVRWADLDQAAANFWVSFRVKLAQLRPFGLCGYGRFERALALVEPQGIDGIDIDDLAITIQSTLDEGLDVDEQPESPRWQVPDDLKTTGVTAGKAAYFSREFKRKVGTALELELFDEAPDSEATFGDGLVLHGFALEMRAEPGLRRVPREMQR